jgi:hypothetical protein
MLHQLLYLATKQAVFIRWCGIVVVDALTEIRQVLGRNGGREWSMLGKIACY